MGADALADLGHGTLRGWRPSLGLPHAGERQRAERRKTAGDQAGTLQEGAAVDAAIRLAGKGSETAVPRLTFRSLDQQFRLPISSLDSG
jgi:hypothetical protein